MKNRNFQKIKKLLLVGPTPPPIGGSPLTVQAIIDELSNYSSLKLAIINTSPMRDIRKKTTRFNFEKVWRMILIFPKYIWKLKNTDVVLVFANNLFALTAAPFFLLFARLFRKLYFLKPVGGDLDLFIKSLLKPIRVLFLSTLRAADGIFVQTQLLNRELLELQCENVIYLPGFRTKPTEISHAKEVNRKSLRLIFLAHIMRPKGPIELLKALQLVSKTCTVEIMCDFYGPIHDEIRSEFLCELGKTKTARYCGMAEPGSGSRLIASYDALVLPTYFICEGHTGVLIEAMHVGVPVISTQHRSIPELVTDGENGILVPPQDVQSLADGIQKLALDCSLRERMGKANMIRGEEFRSERIVSKLIDIMFQ